MGTGYLLVSMDFCIVQYDVGNCFSIFPSSKTNYNFFSVGHPLRIIFDMQQSAVFASQSRLFKRCNHFYWH